LEVAVGSVGRSERETGSSPGRRRSADAELWRPLRARRSNGTRDEVGKVRLLSLC
jgi:hypothetical protein